MHPVRLTPILATLVAALTCGPAQAVHPVVTAKPHATVVAAALVSPLSLAVADDGTRWFSQNFAGLLMRQRPGHRPTTMFSSARHDEVGAVSIRNGTVTFAVTGHGAAHLKQITPAGKVRSIADLGGYEKRVNPDHAVTYGFAHIGAACAKQVPRQVPISYTGLVDSHPYATTTAGSTTYVADAAGNDILGVRHGRVRTVALLPRIPVVISRAGAHANHLPACAIGKTYYFEAVPTDVERTPDGMLYVSTLPGGPEDGSLGAQARVLRVDPRTGGVTVLAKDLISAVGLAVAHNGDIYVSELFAGVIARIPHGTHHAQPFLKVPLPGDVEWTGTGLQATANVLAGGLSGESGDQAAGEVVSIGR